MDGSEEAAVKTINWRLKNTGTAVSEDKSQRDP
jgi:hypothetical protein